MNRKEIKEYQQSLDDMPRWKLVKENVKMKKQLDALSKICDTEDVYNAYNEQQRAQRDLIIANRHLNKVKEVLQKALSERGIKYDNKWDIKTLVHFLIRGTDQQSINQ